MSAHDAPHWTPENPPPGYYYNAQHGQFMLIPNQGPMHVHAGRVVNNGAGSSALVFGILSLAIGWIPVLGLICALLAIGLGAIGVRNANRGEATNRGAAVTGIVCGCISIGASVAFLILFTALMNQPH